MIVERDHIGIFGKMNAGKSSVMNLLTQQATSIVDQKPGTTTDTKIALAEIHGLGPVKIFDTAGLDEAGKLGQKKKVKAETDLKECDLVLIIVDPASSSYAAEKNLLNQARALDKQVLILYNTFSRQDEGKIVLVEREVSLLKFYKKLTIKAVQKKYRQVLLKFILENFESKNAPIELLPFIKKNEYYLLNIPMDAETPPGRYLRPQAMCEEYITRHWAYPASYRMDLKKARSKKDKDSEKKRFLKFIDSFKIRPALMITDSQAMDIVPSWLPKDIGLTTFSIVMINYFSRGRLNLFARGVKALDKLQPTDKILITEACNHSRINEDIGTVQIPNIIKRKFPGVIVEHNFGREFQENKKLEKYKLIIHCGGCMISSQKLLARIRDLEAVGIPFTNYGTFLSYVQGEKVFKRVLKPWGITTTNYE